MDLKEQVKLLTEAIEQSMDSFIGPVMEQVQITDFEVRVELLDKQYLFVIKLLEDNPGKSGA